MKTAPLLAVIAALSLLVLAACSSGNDPAQTNTSERPRIVATVGMVADITRNVAGEHADVTSLMGPGVDPHLYKPTRADVERLMNADIILYNGLLLEGKLTDTLIRTANAGKPVFAVTSLIPQDTLLAPEDFEGHDDPHVWMDPSAWVNAVESVAQVLSDADPEHADAYRANANAYIAQLTELDAYAQRILSSVPEQRRVLVTAHDAFNYFGRRYGYDVVGIQGISTQSEAGVLDIERMVDLIVEREVPAVFVESTVSDRNIEALIAGARARGHSVVIGAELFSDAMGPQGTYEGTYIGMIDHNVTSIARALGADAPELGLNGKLAP